jgi:hypothetical protein
MFLLLKPKLASNPLHMALGSYALLNQFWEN